MNNAHKKKKQKEKKEKMLFRRITLPRKITSNNNIHVIMFNVILFNNNLCEIFPL